MNGTDARKLAGIVAAGAAVRVATLWLYRPEFTGWLNHTYYYFVQVLGLLEDGAMPFRDMPLLFHLEAGTAAVLTELGLAHRSAVVAATRLWMCLVPPLTALPTYYLARAVSDQRSLRPAQWLLVGGSAFYPLSLSYLPEFLQKNTLGILLLMGFVSALPGALRQPTLPRIGLLGLLGALISISHFGTLAALAACLLSTVVAIGIVEGRSGSALRWALFAASLAAAGLAVVRLFDPDRFERIWTLARTSAHHSAVGQVLAGDLEALGPVLLPLLAIGVLAVWVRRLASLQRLSQADRVFLWSQLLFATLLLLPIVDRQVAGRLALFLIVPVTALLVFSEASIGRSRLRTLLVASAVGGTLLLGVGELVSSRIHASRHRGVLADVLQARQQVPFTPQDLVVAPTGVEHASAWFFGTKASVLTSVTRTDFSGPGNVYLVNPGDDLPGARPRGEVATDRDRYAVMRSTIPRPGGARVLFRSEHLEVLQLVSVPEEWVFDADGRWTGFAANIADPHQ